MFAMNLLLLILETAVSAFPIKKNIPEKELGITAQESRSYIPAFLPPLPSSHAYVHTPVLFYLHEIYLNSYLRIEWMTHEKSENSRANKNVRLKLRLQG